VKKVDMMAGCQEGRSPSMLAAHTAPQRPHSTAHVRTVRSQHGTGSLPRTPSSLSAARRTKRSATYTLQVKTINRCI